MHLSSLKVLFIYSLLYPTKTSIHIKLSRKKIANNTWSFREKNYFFDIFYQRIEISNPSFHFWYGKSHSLSNSFSNEAYKQTKNWLLNQLYAWERIEKNTGKQRQQTISIELKFSCGVLSLKIKNQKITSKLDEILVNFLFCLII